MKTLIILISLGAIIGFGSRFLLSRRPRPAKPLPSIEPKAISDDEDRQRLQDKLARTTPTLQATPEHDDADLSDSSVVSVSDEIDRCIAAGLWNEAIKWSHHAIQSRPDSVKFKMKQAEAYFGAGAKEELGALYDELAAQLPDDSEDRKHLAAMVAKLIPDRLSDS